MLNSCSPDFVARLESLLPEATLTAPEPRWLEEPRGKWKGQAGSVARPRSTAEVATIVRACAEARVGIVPWGGGTGLVSGQVMPEGPLPLVLSLERMNRLRAVHPSENVALVEAGMTLAEVHAAAEAVDRLFPLTLASQGTCRIGGNLSTNAGGVNVVRYGNARDLCLGLEAVLPDGTVWNGLKRLRKDNTGYDLRGLLIGAEGSLGVITAAALRLYPRMRSEAAALLVVPGPEEALRLLGLAQDRIGPGVAGFELISGQGLQFLAETMPQVRQPFADIPEWMVLVDVGLHEAAEEALMGLFEAGAEAGLVLDGTLSQSAGQRAALWDLRETIPLANRAVGAISSHDISLPLSEIPGFIPEARAALMRLAPFRINCFGHLGDGNLHFNVFPPKGGKAADYRGMAGEVQELVHQMVVDRDGSFSAEHGLGRLKVADLERWGDPGKLAAMRAIKAALDPQGIMNPGAVLR